MKLPPFLSKNAQKIPVTFLFAKVTGILFQLFYDPLSVQLRLFEYRTSP